MNIMQSWMSLSLVALLLVLGTTPAAATGSGDWTPPENMSGWQDALEVYRLETGADGTLALVWPIFDLTVPQAALYARVRQPGGSWEPAKNLSGNLASSSIWNPRYWNAKVAPDGTAWVAWTDIDDTQTGDNRRVMVAHRPPGGTWQTEALWGYETEIRSADLAVGPAGDIAVAWVACAADLTTPSQGPCALQVRRRFAGAAAWEPIERLDQSPSSPPDMGIWRAYALVGPGGLTVVVWVEANPANSNEWAVRAARWDSKSATWHVNNDVSNGWFVPLHDEGLAQPVMGEDGTVVVAWTGDYSLVPSPLAGPNALPAHQSATMNSAGTWSLPAPISTLGGNDLGSPWLSLKGGVTVAAWERQDTSGKWAIYANARDAGGTWGSEQQVSPASATYTDATIHDLRQWPGGTAVILWSAYDNSRPADQDSALFWSGRSPSGTWGGAGQGQLGDWAPNLYGSALALAEDGSGAALWATEDSSQPTNQQGTLLAATWPPGGPAWSQPHVIDSGRKLTLIYSGGAVAVPDRSSVAAAWLAGRVGTVINPAIVSSLAIFFSELAPGRQRVYLPLLLRNYR